MALRAEQGALRAELDGYADDAAEGRIDRAFAAKVVGKLQAKVSDVQRRIEQSITPPALAGLLASDPGEDVTTRWDRAPTSAKREVLRLLFSAIVEEFEVPTICDPDPQALKRRAQPPVGLGVQRGDHHQQVAALGLEAAAGVAALVVDGVPVPVQHRQAPLDGAHET